MWQCHGSHGHDDVIMSVATVSTLFWWSTLTMDEFWYETSYIENVISLPFYAYVECQKRITNTILTSVLIWMWSCHSSHRHDDVIMRVATVSILFWWFLFIMNEFWYKTSYIRNGIFLSFYAYVERQKRITNMTLTTVLVWMWQLLQAWWCHHVRGYCEHTILMISIYCKWYLTWDQLHWISYLLIFLCICRTSKMKYEYMTSILVWMWSCHSSHGHWWR
jgi:hypothetical protein